MTRRGTLPALLLCAALWTACGDSDPAGPSDQTIPDIVGTYAGTWNISASVPSSGQEERVSCPGSAIIEEQAEDGGFSGYWTQVGNHECVAASGTLAGTVAAGGALTISDFVNTTGGTLEEATGGQCVSVPGSDTFEGSADGRTLEVSRASSADCQGTEFVFSWELSATRTD